MNNYIIYCTEEQTKKALELGAPIEYIDDNTLFGKMKPKHSFYVAVPYKYYRYYLLPTTQQMIEWLETQMNISSIEVDIEPHKLSSVCITWRYFIYDWKNDDTIDSNWKFNSRKEATLAAIDAALKYLTQNKK